MNKKLLITAVVIAVVAAGYYFYANGFSFSQSDAAGYGDAVSIQHVIGPQSVTFGETVNISWPRGFASGRNPVTVQLLIWTGKEVTPEPDEVGILSGNVTGNKYTWVVDPDNWKGGLPDGIGQIQVRRQDGSIRTSDQFRIVGTAGL